MKFIAKAIWKSDEDTMETFLPLEALTSGNLRTETEGPRAWYRTGITKDNFGVKLYTPKSYTPLYGEREWELLTAQLIIPHNSGSRTSVIACLELSAVQTELWGSGCSGVASYLYVHHSRLEEIASYRDIYAWQNEEKKRARALREEFWKRRFHHEEILADIACSLSRDDVRRMWSRGKVRAQQKRIARTLLTSPLLARTPDVKKYLQEILT